jgi:hypothetical protein
VQQVQKHPQLNTIALPPLTMGHRHSRAATPLSLKSKSMSTTPEGPSSEHNPSSPRVVRPSDLVERDPGTALHRMLPMAHEKIRQLPIRIDAVCITLNTCSHENGPDAGLASSARDLSESMRCLYAYLRSWKSAPESNLPFSGPDLAEAVGTLALQLDRWVRDFEEGVRLVNGKGNLDTMAVSARTLVEHCDQMKDVLLSVKQDKCLDHKRSRSTGALVRPKKCTSLHAATGRSIFSRRSLSLKSVRAWMEKPMLARGSTSSQAGMGRSVFGV